MNIVSSLFLFAALKPIKFVCHLYLETLLLILPYTSLQSFSDNTKNFIELTECSCFTIISFRNKETRLQNSASLLSMVRLTT